MSKKVNDIYITIGKKLKEIRLKNNNTQVDLSKILDVSYQQYQKYETGKNRIPVYQLMLICQQYNCSMDSFIPDNIK